MNGSPSFVRGQPSHLTGQAKRDSLLAGASAASSVPFFLEDHRPGGAEDPADPQTTLQILQQQLESFQTFRQQTLENINMVQSKIRGILTTNRFETKTPLWSSDKTRVTCTPSDASLLLENPESLPSKRKVHHDQQLRSDEHMEANANAANVVRDINIEHRFSLKTIAAEMADNSEDLFENNSVLARTNGHQCGHWLSGTGLETERWNAAHQKVIFGESTHRTPFPKFGEELPKRDNTNYPTKLLKEELQKPDRNDLDLLAGNAEKSGFLSRDKLNHLKEGAKVVTSLDESHTGLVLVKESGRHFDQEFYEDSRYATVWSGWPTTAYSEKAESQSKTVRKDLRIHYSEGATFPVNPFPEMVKAKLLTLDSKEQLQKEEPPATILNQTLLRQGNQKLSEINVASEYNGKIKALQKSLKNSEHVQKTVHVLPNENLALKSNVEPLTLTIQSLKEKLPTCNRQPRDSAEETKSVQMLLGKSQEDDNECIQEANNFLRKRKELQNQNTLEEERNQLHNGNQRSRQTQHGFQMRNQKVDEEKKAVTCKQEGLSALLEFLPKEQFKLQETNQNLKMEILQLTREDSSREQELDRNCSQRQQIQEKETAAKSDLATPLHFMPTLEDKKLNLEGTLQECSGTAQVLQKDFEQLQSDKAYTEDPLMTELRNVKADTDLLGSNFTRIRGEYNRLSIEITSIMEEIQLIRKKLQEYGQEISQYESDIGKLTEEHFLLKNQLQTPGYERDGVQPELHHLQEDNISLQHQDTARVCEQTNPGYFEYST